MVEGAPTLNDVPTFREQDQQLRSQNSAGRTGVAQQETQFSSGGWATQQLLTLQKGGGEAARQLTLENTGGLHDN